MFNQENDDWKCFRLIFNPVDHPGASSRAQIAKERFFWDTLYQQQTSSIRPCQNHNLRSNVGNISIRIVSYLYQNPGNICIKIRILVIFVLSNGSCPPDPSPPRASPSHWRKCQRPLCAAMCSAPNCAPNKHCYARSASNTALAQTA